MKITKKIVLWTAIGMAFSMTSLPLAAAGSKENEETEVSVPENSPSLLRVVGEKPPVGFGEGGGLGAAELPDGVSIDPAIVGKTAPIVSAEMTQLSGTLKVKGGKGKRKFTLNCDDGKKYELQMNGEGAEDFAVLKGKKLNVRGVFYSKTFLVFDYGLNQ